MWLLWTSLLACRDDGVALDDCTRGADETHNGDRSRVVQLDDGSLGGPMDVQVDHPWGDGRYGDDGSPVAVFVHGAWATDAVPLSEDRGRLSTGAGLVSLYLNLPGGLGESSTPGNDDRRGASSRQAVALALRYAADELADEGGCKLGERVPGGVAEVPVLAGFSNGGNLAWATLADDALDLPPVAGVATYETPIASQFILAEPGTYMTTSPIYEPGSCALVSGNGVECDYGYDHLAWDPEAEGLTVGVLFIDTDGDGRFGAGDFELGSVQDKSSELWVQSTPARLAAGGLVLDNRAPLADTAAFWEEREAPRAMPAAAQRFPELGGISVGSEVDHILTGAVDHPHVTGMVAAMQAVGIWARLQPDASYVEAVTGSQRGFVDLPADTVVAVSDSSLPMEPEDDTVVFASDYLTAAVLELADRAQAVDWSDDLAAPLFP